MSIHCCNRLSPLQPRHPRTTRRSPGGASKGPRGLTLVETLISAALVLLVLGLGMRFLIPLLQLQQTEGERVELHQRAGITLAEIRRDLHRTSPGGTSLAISPEQVLLAMHPCENIAHDGTLVWQDQLILYRWDIAEEVLTRSIWSDPNRALLRASAPTRLEPGHLQSLVGQPMILAREIPGITLFEVDHRGVTPASLTYPLTVRLQTASPRGLVRTSEQTVGRRLPSS